MNSDGVVDRTVANIVPILACVLNQLCTRNDQLQASTKTFTKFHALRPPAISIHDYLARVAKYGGCSGECFVLALVYIDRIIQGNPTFIVNSLNIHRLLITSVMLGAKYFDDFYFNNQYYGKVGGVPTHEVNALEVEFLFMTNFSLFVTTDTYRQYYTELCHHATSSSCSCRNQNVAPLVMPRELWQSPTYQLEDGDDDDNNNNNNNNNDSRSTSTADPSSSSSRDDVGIEESMMPDSGGGDDVTMEM
jgi:hypothetical protein